MRERLRNYWLLLRMLPVLAISARKRQVLHVMMRFVRQLPQTMQQPLPKAMQDISRSQLSPISEFSEKQVRDLADLASVLERKSVPGICLKRSLTRFHYLHQRVPFEVVFGAKLKGGLQERQIAGHAWLTVNGEPYYESAENYSTYTPIFRWPQEKSLQTQTQADADHH